MPKRNYSKDAATALDPEADAPSKSARKREMHALQDLASALSALSDRQLRKLPPKAQDETFLEELRIARSMQASGARQRQLRFLAKLLEHMDCEPLREHLETLNRPQQDDKRLHHAAETARDRLLTQGIGALEEFCVQFPAADTQRLRQLIAQHQREAAQQRPPVASRQLFRYLRDLMRPIAGPDPD